MSAVQILELHALTHVAHEVPGESRLISAAKFIAVEMAVALNARKRLRNQS